MNKTILLIFFFIPFFSHADHIPENNSYSQASALVRTLKKVKDKTYLTEIESGQNYDDKNFNKLKSGFYYKVADGQKFGFFGSVQSALRHSNDWISKKDKYWIWKDTSNRYETLINVNYDKRFVPKFDFPLVLNIKNEIEHNLSNEKTSFIFKPGLNYFFLKNGIPKFSYHLNFPIYIGLNFSTSTPYKTGIYNSFLYHKNSRYKFGLSLLLKQENWVESKEFERMEPNKSYESTDSITHIRFEVIINF